MALDARLQAVADFVLPGSRVVDVGTDHAYLALELLRQRGAFQVIAADKNAGPCEAARHTIREAGLEGIIPVRQGDGLAVLVPDEVDTICIAGMGGQLIRDILAAAPEILQGASRLVLQPMNAAAGLRRWLYEQGWQLVDESLAEADGRVYEILAAEPGEAALPEPLLLESGPVLFQKKPPLLRRHIQGLLERERRAAAGMEKSEQARESAAYRVMRDHIRGLEEKLRW